GFYCSCRSPAQSMHAASRKPIKTAGREDDDFCPRCGLRVARQSLPGSITAYLFQDIRCKCPPEGDFNKGAMAAKLQQLRTTDPGTTFSSSRRGINKNRDYSIDLADGAIIGGAYRIIELIGVGGMSEVYLAEHISLHKKCALKVIPPDQVTEEGWRRF